MRVADISQVLVVILNSSLSRLTPSIPDFIRCDVDGVFILGSRSTLLLYVSFFDVH